MIHYALASFSDKASEERIEKDLKKAKLVYYDSFITENNLDGLSLVEIKELIESSTNSLDKEDIYEAVRLHPDRFN